MGKSTKSVRTRGGKSDPVAQLVEAVRAIMRHYPHADHASLVVAMDEHRMPSVVIPVYPVTGPARETTPVLPFPKELRGRRKPSPPTTAMAKATLRAWLAAYHPDAQDVQLESYNCRGSGETLLDVLGPPKGEEWYR